MKRGENPAEREVNSAEREEISPKRGGIHEMKS